MGQQMDFILSILLIFIGGFIVVANWVIFYNGLVKKKFSSWVPIFGGLFLSIGLGTFPNYDLFEYAWIPFFIDWGCVPGFSHTIWFYSTRKNK